MEDFFFEGVAVVVVVVARWWWWERTAGIAVPGCALFDHA